MKKICLMATFITLIGSGLVAQKHEIGIGIGVSNFLGDLGGANDIGTPFLRDVEAKAFRPAGTIFYQYNCKRFVSINVSLSAGELRGDDKWLSAQMPSKFWSRHYRNLNFKSPFVELTLMAHFDLLRYKKIYKSHSYFTPFIGAGVGVFYMNPKAYYNGAWIPLQSLGTEGQGLPGHRTKYSLIQPNFPISIGFKYQYNKHWKFTLECIHHITLTDYIDDVSTSYVDPAELYNNYSPEQASLIYALSRRSIELDPDNTYGAMTAPGQQRGDPKDKDSYFMILFKVSYVFGTKRYDYNCFKK